MSMLSDQSFKKGQHSFAGIRRSSLAANLAVLQRQLVDSGRSLLVVIDGWECAGKGYVLNQILRELDPRYYEVTLYEAPDDRESRRLSLQRYFNQLPARGQIMVFDRSQYWELLHDPEMSEERFQALVADVRFLEELLVQDHTAVVKCFLHHSRALMAERVAKERRRLAKDERFLGLRARLDNEDAVQLASYAQCMAHFDRVLEATSDIVPWHIIPTKHKKDAARQVLGLLNSAIIDLLLDDESQPPLLPVYKRKPLVKHHQTADPAHYNETLAALQERAGALMHRCYLLGIPVVIAFEGTDAAGKGGTIRRLTRLMDPRGYDVATTAAPTAHELERHYLWRFFRAMPQLGHLTIFDRTWYGRVLVEIVEDLTPIVRCQQAYSEITAMEEALLRHGVVVMKFLLVISKEEQRRRFEARANTPEKRYKLTDEDWRNHEKFDEYERAMETMVAYTDAPVPWTIIDAENKKQARLTVLRHVVDTLETAIKAQEGHPRQATLPRARIVLTLY